MRYSFINCSERFAKVFFFSPLNESLLYVHKVYYKTVNVRSVLLDDSANSKKHINGIFYYNLGLFSKLNK